MNTRQQKATPGFWVLAIVLAIGAWPVVAQSASIPLDQIDRFEVTIEGQVIDSIVGGDDLLNVGDHARFIGVLEKPSLVVPITPQRAVSTFSLEWSWTIGDFQSSGETALATADIGAANLPSDFIRITSEGDPSILVNSAPTVTTSPASFNLFSFLLIGQTTTSGSPDLFEALSAFDILNFDSTSILVTFGILGGGDLNVIIDPISSTVVANPTNSNLSNVPLSPSMAFGLIGLAAITLMKRSTRLL